MREEGDGTEKFGWQLILGEILWREEMDILPFLYISCEIGKFFNNLLFLVASNTNNTTYFLHGRSPEMNRALIL